jgi:hypothetical protein
MWTVNCWFAMDCGSTVELFVVFRFVGLSIV